MAHQFHRQINEVLNVAIALPGLLGTNNRRFKQEAGITPLEQASTTQHQVNRHPNPSMNLANLILQLDLILHITVFIHRKQLYQPTAQGAMQALMYLIMREIHLCGRVLEHMRIKVGRKLVLVILSDSQHMSTDRQGHFLEQAVPVLSGFFDIRLRHEVQGE
ncbi:hypothetical protein ACI0FW_03796 [Alcaligenes nematophilus]